MNFFKFKLFSVKLFANGRHAALFLLILAALLPCCAACSDNAAASRPSTGQIYLYGESHGNDNVYAAELQKWDYCYNEQQMRHLFMELPYYTAEFLNIWMQEDTDDILNEVYADWRGTVTYDTNVRDFYRQIKQNYPETIFHGTDLGHQYASTGQRYLDYLKAHGSEDSENWRLAQECIEQGQKFYTEDHDMDYREDVMTENFIREFDQLADADIMGIYGAAHTWLGDADANNCMASRLQARYGEKVQSEDLSYLAQENTEPLRMDTLTIADREYQAGYFGEQDLRELLPEYNCRRFWRLEKAYADFLNCPTNDDVLPYNNYPMQVEAGHVYLVEYETADGELIRRYYRADGNTWQGMPVTEGIDIE